MELALILKFEIHSYKFSSFHSEMWRGDAKIESWGTKIYGTLLENRKGKQNLLGFVCMQMFMIGGNGLKQLQEEIEAELRNL